MSQYVFYSEWEDDGGTCRIEFFAASPDVLADPQYVELPDDVVTVEKYDLGFDKFPLGMAKAPALELSVRLALAGEYSSSFRDLFLRSTIELGYGFSGIYEKKFTAGTVVRLSVPGNADFFVGIIRDDTEIEIDMITGEIKATAIHWIKVAFDSVDFEPIAIGLHTDYSIEYSNLIHEAYLVETYAGKGKRFGFAKLYELGNYIDDALNMMKKKLLRIAVSADSVQVPETLLYRQNFLLPGHLGSEIAYEDIYLLATIESSTGTKKYGGLFFDLSSGISSYKSLWDFLAEWSESRLCRTYIDSGFMRTRPAVGKFGSSPAIVVIDSDRLASAKITLNHARLSVVVGSKIESVSSDVSKYENSRASSRNGDEYTVPVLFESVPPAATTYVKKKYDNVTSQRSEEPHIWGLYYKASPDFVKAHHYHRFRLTQSKYSSNFINAYYYGLSSEALSLLSEGEARQHAIAVQTESGAARWSTETLRALYDRNRQARIELEYDLAIQEISDPLGCYYAVDFGEASQELNLPSYVCLCVSYEYDFQTNRVKLELISVDDDAI